MPCVNSLADRIPALIENSRSILQGTSHTLTKVFPCPVQASLIICSLRKCGVVLIEVASSNEANLRVSEGNKGDGLCASNAELCDKF